MNLLLTNDDNIHSLFLHALARALQSAGHTTYIAAPLNEQSWIGAAKSRRRPVTAKTIDKNLNCPTWAIDGTPADCVNIALAHLLPKNLQIDAVLSGINVGRNISLGFILASGTIAGAWEGALHGIPAIAYSLDLPKPLFDKFHSDPQHPPAEITASLQAAATHAARLATPLIQQTPPQKFIVQNINFPFPCPPDAQVQKTIPARILVPNIFTPPDSNDTHHFNFTPGQDITPQNLPTDLAAINAGHISHTTLDYTRLGQ